MNRILPRLPLFAAAALLLLTSASRAQTEFDSQGALKVQDGRNKRVKVHALSQYKERWDLGDLPGYVPREQVSGMLHIWGSNYVKDGKLAEYWEAGFRKFQPGVTFDWQMNGGDTGTVGLTSDLADIGVLNEITYAEELGFERRHFYSPTELMVMTGAFNVPGWAAPLCVIVNARNPLAKLSLRQLDGIFGSQRSGGWIKTAWHPEFARGSEEDLRRWDQVGLTGEWAGKPINTYGFTLRYHAMTAFSDKVLKGSDQWNEDTRRFANFLTPDGAWRGEADQVIDAVKADACGIGVLTYRDMGPGAKVLALARTEEGPGIDINLQNVRSRAYPLVSENYFYINHKPGTKLDPKLREFLHYVFSREGQDAIQRDAKFLPLTAEVVRAQLAKID